MNCFEKEKWEPTGQAKILRRDQGRGGGIVGRNYEALLRGRVWESCQTRRRRGSNFRSWDRSAMMLWVSLHFTLRVGVVARKEERVSEIGECNR